MLKLARAMTTVSTARYSLSVWRRSVVQRGNVGISGTCLVMIEFVQVMAFPIAPFLFPLTAFDPPACARAHQ